MISTRSMTIMNVGTILLALFVMAITATINENESLIIAHVWNFYACDQEEDRLGIAIIPFFLFFLLLINLINRKSYL